MPQAMLAAEFTNAAVAKTEVKSSMRLGASNSRSDAAITTRFSSCNAGGSSSGTSRSSYTTGNEIKVTERFSLDPGTRDLSRDLSALRKLDFPLSLVEDAPQQSQQFAMYENEEKQRQMLRRVWIPATTRAPWSDVSGQATAEPTMLPPPGNQKASISRISLVPYVQRGFVGPPIGRSISID